MAPRDTEVTLGTSTLLLLFLGWPWFVVRASDLVTR